MKRNNFWKNKKVFITGQTGFKGAWLSLWLQALGAKVTGFALKPPTKPSLFELCRIDELINSNINDIRNVDALNKAIRLAKPEIVFHLAAQPLVRESYKVPVETFEINVMGTVNLLESLRGVDSVRAVVNVTTDKCYENLSRVAGRGSRVSGSRVGNRPCETRHSTTMVILNMRDGAMQGGVDLRHGRSPTAVRVVWPGACAR